MSASSLVSMEQNSLFVQKSSLKRHVVEDDDEPRDVKRPSSPALGWDFEDEGSAIDEAFRNNVVARKIFEYLTILDLFNCSLVSRTWRLNARAALRKRCLLYIHLDRHSPWDIENLVQLLEKSPVVPFSGLSLTCSYTWPSGYNDGYAWGGVSIRAQGWWDRLAHVLVAKIGRFHALKLDCGDSWDDVVERLIARIFPRVYEQLESLKWKGQISSASRLLRGHRSLKTLPRLESFEFCGTSTNPAPEKLAQRIICASPKLRKLKGFVNPSWLTSGILTFDDVSWVKEFACDFTPESLSATYEFAKRKPPLERLHISPFSSPFQSGTSWTEEAKKLIKSTTGLLFRNCSETLCELIVVQEDLEQLLERESHISGYKNLKYLKLYGSRRHAASNSFVVLHLNFALLFPNLTRVEIHMFEAVDLVGEVPTMGACPSVRTLVLENAGSYMGVYDSSSYLVEKLALKFPNIRHLYMKSLGRVGLDSLPDNLWRSWAMLESLNLVGLYLSSLKSWDAALSGFSAEKLSALISLSVEELKNECSPGMFSICNLKHLKTLRLEVIHNQCNYGSRINPGAFVISQVAGACALSRIPGFLLELFCVGRFNVEPDSRFRLDHLASLVNIKSEDIACPSDLAA